MSVAHPVLARPRRGPRGRPRRTHRPRRRPGTPAAPGCSASPPSSSPSVSPSCRSSCTAYARPTPGRAPGRTCRSSPPASVRAPTPTACAGTSRSAAGCPPSTASAGWAACRCCSSCPSGSRSTTCSPTSRRARRSARWTPGSCRRWAPRRSSASPSPAAATSAAEPAHLAVVAGLAVTAATLSYVTQRYVVASNTVTEGLPEAMATAQRVMPALSAVGLLVAGGVVPVTLLAYWVCSSTWTLGQSAVVARWFPTPGTPRRPRLARRDDDGCRPCARSRRGGAPRRPRLSGRVRSTTARSSPAAIRSSSHAKRDGILRGDAGPHVAPRQDGVGQARRPRGPATPPGASSRRPERRSRLPTVSSTTSYLSVEPGHRLHGMVDDLVGAERAHQVGVAGAAHAGDVRRPPGGRAGRRRSRPRPRRR